MKETAFNKANKINLVLMAIVWLSCSFGYYMINYQLKYLKGDIYINAFVTSGSEITAYLISGYLFEKFGLKMMLSISLMISIIGMGSLIAYQKNGDS